MADDNKNHDPIPPADAENPPHEDEFRESELASEMNVARVHGSIMREREDPSDGYEPVPLWLVTLIMVVVFWSGMYLAFNSGGFRSDVFNPELVSWSGGGVAEDTGPPDPMVVGRKVFVKNCVVCHQSSGQGVPGQFPPLVDSEWVASEDWHGDNHLVQIVLHGLQGPVQVGGEAYNNVMTPWQDILGDEEIAAVLTYIRNDWGNEAPPITPEFVAAIRAEYEGRSAAWTQAELQEVDRKLMSEQLEAGEEAVEVEEATNEAADEAPSEAAEETADDPPAPDTAEPSESPAA